MLLFFCFLFSPHLTLQRGGGHSSQVFCWSHSFSFPTPIIPRASIVVFYSPVTTRTKGFVMGHRHNRRRMRIRSRSRRNVLHIEPPAFRTSICDLAVPTAPEFNDSLGQWPCCESAVYASCEPIQTYPAPIWHLGYVAWQQRERRLQLEAEQFRLFGGEPGDEVDLCYRMLEYFAGLDYINP